MMSVSDNAVVVRELVNGFVSHGDGVHEAIAVGPDGIPLAISDGLTRDAADRFAAVAAGLMGLSHGAADRFDGGTVHEVIVEMDNAIMLVTGMPDGSSLAAVADADCDLGTVGYDLAVLADKTGSILNPALRQELQFALPR